MFKSKIVNYMLIYLKLNHFCQIPFAQLTDFIKFEDQNK